MQSITFTERPQIDGTKFVTFTLTDDQGVQHIEIGLHPNAFDPNTILTATAARWDQMLIDAEINANLEEAAGN